MCTQARCTKKGHHAYKDHLLKDFLKFGKIDQLYVISMDWCLWHVQKGYWSKFYCSLLFNASFQTIMLFLFHKVCQFYPIYVAQKISHLHLINNLKWELPFLREISNLSTCTFIRCCTWTVLMDQWFQLILKKIFLIG